MKKYRTDVEQVEGLEVVMELVPGSVLILRPGDVPALRLGELEVVFAVGGYDVWSAGGGNLLRTDLTSDDAAHALREGTP